MIKKIRFVLGILVIALGFFFCFCMVSVNAAEDVETTTTEQVNVIGVYEYNVEGQGNAKFTLYSDNSFDAELHDLEKNETIKSNGTYILDGNVLILNAPNGVLKFKINGNKLEPYEESEATQTIDPNSFLSHLKDLKWDEFQTIVGWIIAYLVANLGIIALFVVKIIKDKYNDFRKSNIHNTVMEQLDADHKKEIENKEQAFNDKLDALYVMIDDNNKEQKAKIEALSNDKTAEIEKELANITKSYTDNE